jgi:hypothetical protein
MGIEREINRALQRRYGQSYEAYRANRQRKERQAVQRQQYAARYAAEQKALAKRDEEWQAKTPAEKGATFVVRLVAVAIFVGLLVLLALWLESKVGTAAHPGPGF